MEDFSPPDMFREFFEWVNKELDALHARVDALLAPAAPPAEPPDPAVVPDAPAPDAQENAGG